VGAVPEGLPAYGLVSEKKTGSGEALTPLVVTLPLNTRAMAYLSLHDAQFDQALTLREAYRLMERFAADYLARGDTPVSDFLFAYAGELQTGQTADPAAIYDFLTLALEILQRPADKPDLSHENENGENENGVR
jgi:hypothetical protein